MRLALAQMTVEPGRPEENLARAEERILRAAQGGADTVLLPETLDCGWTHPSARELAGPVPGGMAYERLRKAAVASGVMVCAGLVERSGDLLYNAAVLISPDGELLLHHRKLNELDFARKLYVCGNRLGVAETPHGRVGVMICADAFAKGLVITRTLGHMGARIILSPCAWAVPPDYDNVKEPYGRLWRRSYGPPARGRKMWIAGCSNVGPVTAGEWAGWQCIGCSMVVGPDGQVAVQAAYGAHTDGVLTVDIPAP
ncbi:MAG TPA: carbon-nitrogen hydrolase family protein [Verrucomicrobiales bacterium]|nr:carbon-nitrogen hydrolase family protein [Verrucomicrobiales bacterium]